MFLDTLVVLAFEKCSAFFREFVKNGLSKCLIMNLHVKTQNVSGYVMLM